MLKHLMTGLIYLSDTKLELLNKTNEIIIPNGESIHNLKIYQEK